MKLTIDRAKVASDVYDYRKYSEYCYIGHLAKAIKEVPSDCPVSEWAIEKYGDEWEYDMSDSCFGHDEDRAAKLFAAIGVDVEFVGV